MTPNHIELILAVVSLAATGVATFVKVSQKAEVATRLVENMRDDMETALDLAREERKDLERKLTGALREIRDDNAEALQSVRREFGDAMHRVTQTIEAQTRLTDEALRQVTRAHIRIDQVKSSQERIDKELAHLRGRWLTTTQKIKPIDDEEDPDGR
jgi:hypothetical protein